MRPSLPSDYVRPERWDAEKNSAATVFGGMNRSTAGPRFERQLPRGRHSLQLYSTGTPNGQKITVMLEELLEQNSEKPTMEYDAWFISLADGEQFSSGFTDINPNQKIPALVDYDFDPPIRVFEGGNILLYLAEKYGRFIPKKIHDRTECLSWLFWLQASAPVIGGGFGHFYQYAPVAIMYAIDRYAMETKRLFHVLDQRLNGRSWIMGDEITIADFAAAPWFLAVHRGIGYSGSNVFLGTDEYRNVVRWLTAFQNRPAVKRGLRVNGFGQQAIRERHSGDDFLKSKL